MQSTISNHRKLLRGAALEPSDDASIPSPEAEKLDLFGVGVNPVTAAEALDAIMSWARRGRSAMVVFMGVHGLTLAQRDADYRRRLNQFDLVTCDGQPIRWALNRWYGADLAERVYGPAMTLEVCRAAAEQGVSVYFYGSRIEVLERLTARMRARVPGLQIVGAESPPYRPLTDAERDDTVRRINDSGAGIVFIGLGCPKQEIFATEVRGRVGAVQLCVGAAFDLHAGTVPMAPRWMQNSGLEWLYRLVREPRRLWKRYLVSNSQFAAMCILRKLRRQA